MKKSELIALLQQDLEANGDTEEVALCFTVRQGDKMRRLDVFGSINILNDPNYVKGMAYLITDVTHISAIKDMVTEPLSVEQQTIRGALLAETFYLRKDSEHKDRYKTNGGTKTALGIFATAKFIIEEGKL